MTPLLRKLWRTGRAEWALVVALVVAVGQAVAVAAHDGVDTWPGLLVAAVTAAAGLLTRWGVTPTTQPRVKVQGRLVPLVPATRRTPPIVVDPDESDYLGGWQPDTPTG